MIVLDTHAWLFWVDDNLKEFFKFALKKVQGAEILGVSIISCWEIAMLVAKQRLSFSIDVKLWIEQALKYPGIRLLNLDPEIVVMSTRLPGNFHGDPADRIIVATCIKHGVHWSQRMVIFNHGVIFERFGRYKYFLSNVLVIFN